jgi:hypothetical protein
VQQPNYPIPIPNSNNGGFPPKFYLAWIVHLENFVILSIGLGYAMHPSSWPKVGGLNLALI